MLTETFSNCSFVFLLLCYFSKYTAVISMDQRQLYKDDFNAEYDEYRILHARVESIARRFTQLDTKCRRLAQGTKEYQVSKELESLFVLPCIIQTLLSRIVYRMINVCLF